MTKEDLLSGKPFFYTGHMRRLMVNPLKYSPELDAVIDQDYDERYRIVMHSYMYIRSAFGGRGPQGEGFVLSVPRYGHVGLLYCECDLILNNPQPLPNYKRNMSPTLIK